MRKRLSVFALLSVLTASEQSYGAAVFQGAVWWVFENNTSQDGSGRFDYPALILYAKDDNSYGPWHFSAEARIGKGAFTDTANNPTGNNMAIKRAWVAYDVDEKQRVTVGKSQVPFGYGTVNFWPGQMLNGGYADQMDLGLKYSANFRPVSFEVGYFHQDDWGPTSTDTVDDNAKWGSSATYRKIKTVAARANWHFAKYHVLGAAAQAGRLQDLALYQLNGKIDEQGKHQAFNLHYYFDYQKFTLKYQWIYSQKQFDGMASFADKPDVKNHRQGLLLAYNLKPFNVYLDTTWANSDSQNHNNQGKSFAPGVSYSYGPGAIYLEYLWEDAYIDRDGEVQAGYFKALYVSFYIYF